MANPEKLRVRAVGKTLVTDYALMMKSGVIRYVGRALDETIGAEFINAETGEKMRQAAYVPTGEVDVENMAEFRAAVLAGDLEAANKETADACGVPWMSKAAAPKPSKE